MNFADKRIIMKLPSIWIFTWKGWPYTGILILPSLLYLYTITAVIYIQCIVTTDPTIISLCTHIYHKVIQYLWTFKYVGMFTYCIFVSLLVTYSQGYVYQWLIYSNTKKKHRQNSTKQNSLLKIVLSSVLKFPSEK